MRDLIVNGLIASAIVPRALRWRLLRLYGVDAQRSAICGGLWLGTSRLSVGEATFINYDCRIDNTALVTIGRSCDIGPGTHVMTTTHANGPGTRRAGNERHEPVTIGDGAWIGARVTIMPGVSIGSGAIVGTGAVVLQDCDANCVYAGVPAKKIRDLSSTSKVED